MSLFIYLFIFETDARVYLGGNLYDLGLKEVIEPVCQLCLQFHEGFFSNKTQTIVFEVERIVFEVDDSIIQENSKGKVFHQLLTHDSRFPNLVMDDV